MSMKRKARIRLDSLNVGEGFVAKFYASAEDAQADEPCLTLTGVFLGVYDRNSDYCVVEIDGEKGFENSDLQVEKVKI